ncbi:Origin recognition complex subunit 2 [Psilocybe cubensis]|uniref:Origin recognition complex subunit 2 n=2 Tax=Psilocybe cubensis TaxID=181762 RepID=A0ACB8GPQ1_PSICU|nr:Origin recognition complex subunit 2 [Psilocybe cubensis]KAH9477715.1 Origin recognition complex subunit 2 [Psilocybe cubensis]
MYRKRSFAVEEHHSSSEDEDIEDDEEVSEPEDLPNEGTSDARQKGKGKAGYRAEESQIIVETAFDAYFSYNKPGRVQTSSNVYSQLVLPLSPEEYAESIGTKSKGVDSIQPSILHESNRNVVFSRYMCELNEGFNILCYGIGSKRRILNQFATNSCSKRGHVVVGNGFQPDFTMKDLLNAIENIPPIQELDLPSTAIDKQARRIHDFFADPDQKQHLYIIIHNIDASPLRNQKSKSILSLLAHNPRIHIIASIDHINAPLLWSSSEVYARKPDNTGSIPSRGFSWLWHDLTTLVSYDFELAFADRSSLAGAHTGGARRKTDTLAAQNATAMSETAASHILASVTQKAQKLFTLLGDRQLEAIDNSADSGSNDLQQFGMAYDTLFHAARDNFIATSDTALRALLGEFRDHSLVVSAQATTGGGEVLWIPMRKERLANVLRALNPT